MQAGIGSRATLLVCTIEGLALNWDVVVHSDIRRYFSPFLFVPEAGFADAAPF